ncbi:MAG TPA: hypothetical protein VG146_20405 [Verrucomicrobiae bacterium]|nr:hypothetical protein [Verrucomicrobiae bacterium]
MCDSGFELIGGQVVREAQLLGLKERLGGHLDEGLMILEEAVEPAEDPCAPGFKLY